MFLVFLFGISLFMRTENQLLTLFPIACFTFCAKVFISLHIRFSVVILFFFALCFWHNSERCIHGITFLDALSKKAKRLALLCCEMSFSSECMCCCSLHNSEVPNHFRTFDLIVAAQWWGQWRYGKCFSVPRLLFPKSKFLLLLRHVNCQLLTI